MSEEFPRNIFEAGWDAATNRFATVPVPPGSVVLLGDSITDRGNWETRLRGELPHRVPVVNFGNGGDTSLGVLERSREHVVKAHPRVVSILVGANDVGLKLPADQTRQHVSQLIKDFRDQTPNTQVCLFGLLPQTVEKARKIQALNGEYKHIAEEHNVAYAELWDTFADQNGAFDSALSDDQLHPNGAGYVQLAQSFANTLRPLIHQRKTRILSTLAGRRASRRQRRAQ